MTTADVSILVDTSLKTVEQVLESSWLQKVGSNVVHRKDCCGIDKIDAELTAVWQKFPLGDRSLLLAQLTGVTFTRIALRMLKVLKSQMLALFAVNLTLASTGRSFVWQVMSCVLPS